jgi:hypothetical protein
MQRTGTYGRRTVNRARSAQDVETWLGNSLAFILAALAVGAGVIGMLLAFGYINENAANPFQDGMVWLIGGVILAICANAFRREHHIVDEDVLSMGRGEDVDVERGRYEEPTRTAPHTHD